MSLPAAPKDISASPIKGSVVDPVDKAKKEKDIERKLKLYSTIQALRASRLPSNSQVNSVLSYFQQNVQTIQNDKTISTDTQQLLGDFSSILESLKEEVTDKNGDELLQDLVWRTRAQDASEVAADTVAATSKESNAEVKETKTSPDKAKIKEDTSQAMSHIRTLANLLITNSEARKLVTDLSLIGRDLLSRTASKAAVAMAPSPEKMATVDDSTKRDHFVNRDAFGDVKQATADKSDIAANKVASATDETVDEATTAVTSGDEEVVEEKKKGLFSRISGRVPEKHKTVANEHFSRGKKFLAEEYFPKDRRDQWIWRFKKVVIECQSHPEYQSSLRWLLDFIEEYYGHGLNFAQGHADKQSDQFSTPELNKTYTDIRVLLDRFANGKSFDKLILDRVNLIAQDAKEDQELRDWWNRVARYLRNLLLEPGYVTEPKSETDGRKLINDGKKFYGAGSKSRSDSLEDRPLDGVTVPSSSISNGLPTTTSDAVAKPATPVEAPGKYKAHLDNVLDGLGDYINGISENPGNKKFADSVTRFTKDLLFVDDGDGGKLSFKSEMWSDIRTVILPPIVENVGYIPIPRIEYTDDKLDLVIENLTLSGKNLFPNIVSIEAHNYMKFSPYSAVKKTMKDDSRHEFIVTLSQMQADMRDVAFYFDKKSGIPRIKDSGLADVVVGGEGVTVNIHLVSAKNDPASFFQVKDVHVKIDSLKFAIRDSKHGLLYKTLKPLATGLIKRQIAKAIRDGVITGLGFLDGQLISVRDRIQEARKNPDSEGKDASVYSISTLRSAFKRTSRSKEGSIASGEVAVTTSQSQFKIVSNKRNSLLVNKGHPAGWVNRVSDKSEFENGDGDGWKSNAFDIQGAQPVAASA